MKRKRIKKVVYERVTIYPKKVVDNYINNDVQSNTTNSKFDSNKKK